MISRPPHGILVRGPFHNLAKGIGAAMRCVHRRTALRVRSGKVQRKNRSKPTPTYYNTVQQAPVVDRRKPGPGYRHILGKRDVERFIALLPGWEELSRGLNAIVLAPGNDRYAGWHRTGLVAVCAWERDLWQETCRWFHEEHQGVFDKLGVPSEATEDGYVLVKWTISTIHAYQLTHILLHELGHHHDRMTTRSRRWVSRGESYAEAYALRYADRIWERYLDEFGLP